jgi:hypothetical protein
VLAEENRVRTAYGPEKCARRARIKGRWDHERPLVRRFHTNRRDPFAESYRASCDQAARSCADGEARFEAIAALVSGDIL